MLSLQEISDRLEIQDVFSRYSHAIDRRDFDRLDEVFTPDAIIDYTEMGGPRLPVSKMKPWLAEAMERFGGFQHMVATTDLKLNGDTAESSTILFNPMIMADTPDGQQGEVFFCGLWYRDKLVRTPDGWRIAERFEEKSFFHNVPADMPPPPPAPAD